MTATEGDAQPAARRRATWGKGISGRVQPKHVKFVVIGLYNTLFGYCTFAAMHLIWPHMPYMIVLVVSRELSVVSAFIAYRLFVFNVKGHVLTDFLRFWCVYLGALLLNIAALPFFVEVVGLGVLLAQALTLTVAIVASYIGHSRVSFRRSGEPDSDPSLELA